MSLTAEEIIEANKDIIRDARPDTLLGLPCVVATRIEDGKEMAIFYEGNRHIDIETDALSSFPDAAKIIRNNFREGARYEKYRKACGWDI